MATGRKKLFDPYSGQMHLCRVARAPRRVSSLGMMTNGVRASPAHAPFARGVFGRSFSDHRAC